MAAEVFTIGYEGATVDGFITELARHDVALVADLRAVPLSRKKGFSKNVLAAALREYGIAYRHFKPLGTPKEGRDAVKRGDIAAMHRIFGAQLATAEAQQALAELGDLAAAQRTCLLCFERDPGECHRTVVADALKKRDGFAIRPLYTLPI